MDKMLRVKMGKEGEVAGVELEGASLALAGVGGFSVEEALMPTGKRKSWGCFEGNTSAARGAVRFQGAIPSAALELSAEVRQGEFVDVRGEIKDTSGMDRALDVTFALPVKLAGWRWEWTAARAETVKPGRVYPSDPEDFIYLGKKDDGFADEDNGQYCIRTNKLPFTAVCCRDRGIAIAYPVHEPRVFLVRATEHGLSITFSLGVTAITKRFPNRASFRFILYAIDGEWGIRSAAERYYGFFPELFRGYCKRHGNIGSISNPEKSPPPEHLEDMGMAFSENDYQWTNGELPEGSLKLAQKLGLGPKDMFHWRGAWYGFFEAPPGTTKDAMLASMKAQAEGRAPATSHGQNNQFCGCPHELSVKAMYNSCLFDHQGKLERVRFEYPQYNGWLLPFNLDPNLPKPNRATLATDWQFRYIKRWKEKGFRGPFGIAFDAFDDFSGFRRLNFRRNHLEVMEIPATFDPASGRICQVKGFHDWSWLRGQSAMAHKAGGRVMSNVNLEHAMMFGGAYLDVVFRERRSMDHTDERLSVHRMLMGGKPIAFPGGSRAPGNARDWMREARRMLTFGMAPGDSLARWQELKAHMPLVRRVCEAGWKPVPHARAKGLWIERFGDKAGRMYLTVRNPGRAPVKTVLTLAAKALGLNPKRVAVRQVSPEKAVKFAVKGGMLAGAVRVDAQEMIVLAVG